MLLYEYDEKKHLRNTYEEGVQEGIQGGERSGRIKGQKKKAYQSARNMYLRGFSVQDTAGILEEDEKTVSAWYERWGKQ